MVNSWFQQLPSLLKLILTSERSVDCNAEIKTQFKLTDEQGEQYMGVIRKVILQTIRPANLVATIQTDIGLPVDQAKQMALELLGRRFLVMDWYLGGVAEEIRTLGGDPGPYEAEARKLYPEVYSEHTEQEERVPELLEMLDQIPNPFDEQGNPKPLNPDVDLLEVPGETEQASKAGGESAFLRDIGDKLTTSRGRAEVLLRLTALSQQIETQGKSGALPEAKTTELLHGLDALSYAVNTQDLNPLEIAAVQRRLKAILDQVGA